MRDDDEFAARRMLLARCEALIQSYNPKRTTLESHAEAYLASVAHDVSAVEAAFLKEVFYGVLRCRGPLKALMACFFNDMASRVLRSDYSMYTVMSYLCVFRFKELTAVELKKFIAASDPEKMAALVGYVFDADNLESAGVVRAWHRTFDPEYVAGTLLRNLTEARPDIQGFALEQQAKSMGLTNKKKPAADKTKKLTRPRAPNLTKPAPRRVPEPTVIAQLKCRTFPGGNNDDDDDDAASSQGDVAKEPFAGDDLATAPAVVVSSASPEDDSFEEGQEVAAPGSMMMTTATTATSTTTVAKKSTRRPLTEPVEFALHETRSTLHEARKAQEAKIAEACDFDKFTEEKKREGRLVGVANMKPATVRLNTAAILREDALFRAKQRDEAAKIAAYEAELRDPAEFLRWQREMRARDDAAKFEEVVRCRVLAKASADEAAAAKAAKRASNRGLAITGAAEAEAMARQRAADREAVLVKRRATVHHVRAEEKVKARQAMEAVASRNALTRHEVKSELEQRQRDKAREDAVKRKVQEERVRQLKADRVLKPHVTVFDPTETPGHGMLGEMSMVEMQERLRKNEGLAEGRREAKRREILETQVKTRDKLAARVENIRALRDEADRAHRDRHATQRASQEAAAVRKARHEEELLMALVGDLAKKRDKAKRHHDRLRTDEDRAIKGKLFLGQDANLRGQRVMEQNVLAAERRARTLQRSDLERMDLYDHVRARDRAVVADNRSKADRTHRRFLQSQNAAVRDMAAETKRNDKDALTLKKHMYAEERKHVADARDRRHVNQPYAAMINDISITRSRAHMMASTQQANNSLRASVSR